ncbi:GNAT family N-acetyltransferase [Paenibacillus donghaensis]|uniref:N-acetyltransferase domain-containing protein n=1 Tax=Paenibacillus donghaensis TaxID=414771 RepID=A0A2Z2KDY1_9BACL|nr:GNAT family N-acetyltransferase [Paenibacillus donghaensis]ASA21310.1 hypothetical protein B9T62_11240 [Paenibacillus donghaensis]
MNKVEIRRPSVGDTGRLHQFFELVIRDTFTKEGIGDQLSVIEHEINTKKSLLKGCLNDPEGNRYLLAAFHENSLVGTIHYGPANALIIEGTQGTLADQVEVGSVYVHPEFQGQGLGSLLWSEIARALSSRNIKQFCFDSGYATAMRLWKRKFGEPDYILKDQWGPGKDHMIWSRKTGSVPIRFNP